MALPMELVLISGRSGSGKTTALQVLEDLGYYCVDNLPLGLLTTLVDQFRQQSDGNIAVGIDARNLPQDLNRFDDVLQQLGKRSLALKLIFVDARDQTLLTRFQATRRKHPISTEQRSLTEAISHESELLEQIHKAAHATIDTSNLSVHELRSLIKNLVETDDNQQPAILFESFGFKFGVPSDADFVFDIRCLPNPYWQPELRGFNGRQGPIIDFLCQQGSVIQMQQDIASFIERWLQAFVENNRSYLTVAIGCTGGQHRSVYMAEQLCQQFQRNLDNVQVRHRELRP